MHYCTGSTILIVYETHIVPTNKILDINPCFVIISICNSKNWYISSLCIVNVVPISYLSYTFIAPGCNQSETRHHPSHTNSLFSFFLCLNCWNINCWLVFDYDAEFHIDPIDLQKWKSRGHRSKIIANWLLCSKIKHSNSNISNYSLVHQYPYGFFSEKNKSYGYQCIDT